VRTEESREQGEAGKDETRQSAAPSSLALPRAPGRPCSLGLLLLHSTPLHNPFTACFASCLLSLLCLLCLLFALLSVRHPGLCPILVPGMPRSLDPFESDLIKSIFDSIEMYSNNFLHLNEARLPLAALHDLDMQKRVQQALPAAAPSSQGKLCLETCMQCIFPSLRRPAWSLKGALRCPGPQANASMSCPCSSIYLLFHRT
jgi:hypothetical protein